MPGISERPLNSQTLTSLRNCMQDARGVLGIAEAADPKSVVTKIDEFVYAWQKGRRPKPSVLDPEDAPFILGSLWGEQLVRRFGWEWTMVVFHDHGDSSAPAVVTPDRSLAIYPIHFIMGCLQDAGVDATILLSYNMLDSDIDFDPTPGDYGNVMECVHRIVPRE